MIQGLLFLLVSMMSFAEAPTSVNIDEVKLSGTVRLTRENPVPQVFFTDLNGEYYVSYGDFSKFSNAFTTSLKTKKPMSFTYNRKTKNIIAVEGAYNKSTEIYEDIPASTEDSKDKKQSEKPSEEQKK